MNNDLISREALKEHKFVGNKFVQIGGRTNGKTLESINKAYQQGWNDAIDAIIDNAPTVEERPQGEWLFDKENSFTIDMFKCSICGCFGDTHFKFCPDCGADMRGAE